MSFPGRILSSTNIFKPALSYISDLSQQAKGEPSTPRLRHSDPDDIDSSPPGPSGFASLGGSSLRPWHSRASSAEGDNFGGGAGIPMIDYSRTPSPNPYNRTGRNISAAQSEDEDEGVPVSLRPLVDRTGGEGRSWWRNATKSESLGGFLFGTWLGWQVYVGLLVVWSFAVGFVLVLMNRFILWTGVYKFPYPLAHTWIQLAFTHMFLLLAASLTRLCGTYLRRWGFGSMVAPAYPAAAKHGDLKMRQGMRRCNPFAFLFGKSGGIGGGGFFEFDRKAAWIVLPLAVVYVGKTILSNISYAYAALPLYTLSRTPAIPLMLILTSFITRTSHSISTLSSTLVVTLNLVIASIRHSERLIWESIVAGIFSTLFISLYPILLLRTQKKLVAHQGPQNQTDVFVDEISARPSGQSAPEQTRAYWTLLHYTSTLSLSILTLLLLISGEIPNILHNCYFLDVPWFWFMQLLGGLASFAVFATTLAFVRATSPLTSEFVKLPRQAAQMMILEKFKLPVHAWVGVSLVYAGSLWYGWIRREEGRRWEVRRIGGGRR